MSRLIKRQAAVKAAAMELENVNIMTRSENMNIKERMIRNANAADVADVFDQIGTESLIELVNNIADTQEGDDLNGVVFQDMREIDAYLEQYKNDLPELLRFMRDRCGNATGELGTFDVDSPFFWVQETGGLWSYEEEEVREAILAKAEKLAAIITAADSDAPMLIDLKDKLIKVMAEEDE